MEFDMEQNPDKVPPATTELISAKEAHGLSEAATKSRPQAEADTLSASALRWAIRNAEGQTASRTRTYAKYGKTSLHLKFAPAEARATRSTAISRQTATCP